MGKSYGPDAWPDPFQRTYVFLSPTNPLTGTVGNNIIDHSSPEDVRRADKGFIESQLNTLLGQVRPLLPFFAGVGLIPPTGFLDILSLSGRGAHVVEYLLLCHAHVTTT